MRVIVLLRAQHSLVSSGVHEEGELLLALEVSL